MSRPLSKENMSRRWVLLALATLTGTLVFGMPNLSLPVLFTEIAADLKLSLVQLGFIWGMTSFVAIFIGLLGGSLGDRFGTKRILLILCILSGLTGASRGLSTDYYSLLLTSFFWGLTLPGIPVNLHKVAGQWFPARQLGLANSIIAMGFAVGMLLGSFLAASVLSPLLGGWRNVLFVYGLIAVVVGILWFIVHPNAKTADKKDLVPLRQGLRQVIKSKEVWIISLGAFGVTGCFLGLTGYLPSYLKTLGWHAATADRALASFFLCSVVGVVPLSLMADRLPSRRIFLMTVAVMMSLGAGILVFGAGLWVWIAVIVSGFVFDAYMAVYITTTMEVEGIGGKYAGTALGFSSILRSLGGAIAPPLGNSLAVYGDTMPFVLWSSMGLFAVMVFSRLSNKNAVKAANLKAAVQAK